MGGKQYKGIFQRTVLFNFLLVLLCSSSCLLADQMIFIGIAGGTGSGKTTVAKKIHDRFPGSVLICQDFYYRDLAHLSQEERKSVNFDHPEALEFSLLKEHLITLSQGIPIDVPVYDFCDHVRLGETRKVDPSNIVIVEGILLFAVAEVRDLFDLKIFVDTDDDERVLRRIDRDMKERAREFSDVKEQYLTTVKPMHNAFVEPSKKFADIIIPEGGENEMAINLILAGLARYE
jgi:uridine kinase